MKLRQKLAMVLAAAMVVTAVPVTTMAASTNKINKPSSLVEDSKIEASDEVKLQMKFDTNVTNEEFYLEAKDFEFDALAYKLSTAKVEVGAVVDAVEANVADLVEYTPVAGSVEVTVNYDDSAVEDVKIEYKTTDAERAEAEEREVTETITLAELNAVEAIETAIDALDAVLAQDEINTGDIDTTTADMLRATAPTVKIEILSKDEARVIVTAEADQMVEINIIGKAKKGTPAIIVDGQDSEATSGTYVLASGDVVTNKVLTADVDGDPSNISIDGKGTLGNIEIAEAVEGSLSEKTIQIELDRSTDLEFVDGQTIEVEGTRGLAGRIEEVTGTVYKAGDKDDEDTTILEITFPKLANAKKGTVVLKGIQVQAEDSREGADTGEVEVEVRTVKEKGDDENSDAMDKTDLVVANVRDFGLELKAKENVELVAGKEAKKVKIQLNELAAGTINDNRDVFFKLDGATVTEFDKKEFEKDDKVIATLTYDKDDEEFRMVFEDDFNDEIVNKFEFEVEMYAEAAYEGDITVTATSRDFEDMEAVIGSVEAAVVVEADDVVIKVGQNGQEVEGSITISEVEAETFERGEVVVIKLDEDAIDDGIEIKDAEVEVTAGDLEIDEIEIADGEITFEIKRESDEASTITINTFELDATRNTPEGAYTVEIGGDAISDRNEAKDIATDGDKNKGDERVEDVIKAEEFVVVGTKNTEDIQDASKQKEVILVLDSKEYKVDGEDKTAAVAPYLDANNRTMVPLRLVSEEFGALVDFAHDANNVGTITIYKEGTTLQFKDGSNMMNKNGIEVPMDTAATIKDGVTYVPFKFVANGLNADYEWVQETKTIIFKN